MNRRIYGQHPDGRPLSPHLSIYRWRLPMMMSIAHRISGVMLYLGIFLPIYWLFCLAEGRSSYDAFNRALGSPYGIAGLCLLSWSLMLHFFGGLRHEIWDEGYGLERNSREVLCLISLVGSVIATAAIWIAAYLFR